VQVAERTEAVVQGDHDQIAAACQVRPVIRGAAGPGDEAAAVEPPSPAGRRPTPGCTRSERGSSRSHHPLPRRAAG
jgi:hypothetical protein